MNIPRRYLGLFFGITIAVLVPNALLMVDEVKGWELLSFFLIYLHFLISLPAIIYPTRGWISWSIVIAFWGLVGFFCGMLLEKRGKSEKEERKSVS